MSNWNPSALGAYAPAIVGWWLALAGCLRLEELRGDQHAQALLPVLQWGVVALLALTLACIVAASVVLWRGGRGDLPLRGLAAQTVPAATVGPHPSAGSGTARAGAH